MTSTPPPTKVTHRKELSALYLTKRVDITAEITKEISVEETTSVLVHLDLSNHNLGLSLNLLTLIIQQAAEAAGMRTYKIYHDHKGLVLVGKS